MRRLTCSQLMALALFGSAGVSGQQNPAPPAQAPADTPAMNMTPEEMAQMQGGPPAEQAGHAAHARDPALERPAESADVNLPMLPGMDMDDAANHHFVWLENLEAVTGSENGGAWDAQAWFGGDFDKLWLKTEGGELAGRAEESDVEALWAHAVLPFWDTQAGVRRDVGGGPPRTWAAAGVQGLTPYWFDVELTAYVGESGRTAVRLRSEYDLYLTQRLILKPAIELNAYGQPDRARALGAGLAEGDLQLRMRYEFTRRFAPYAGYVYARKFSGTAVLARALHEPPLDHRVVAGLQVFF